MLRAFEPIRSRRCSFLVAGRLDQNDASSPRFLTLSDIDVPPPLASLFLPLPEEVFREDVSSSEIRRRLAGEAGS